MNSWILEERPQQIVLEIVQRELVPSHAVGDSRPHAIDVPNRRHFGPVQNRADGEGVVRVDQQRLQL